MPNVCMIARLEPLDQVCRLIQDGLGSGKAVAQRNYAFSLFHRVFIGISEHPARADNGVSKNNPDRGTPTEGR